jgi:hypothetical protein
VEFLNFQHKMQKFHSNLCRLTYSSNYPTQKFVFWQHKIPVTVFKHKVCVAVTQTFLECTKEFHNSKKRRLAQVKWNQHFPIFHTKKVKTNKSKGVNFHRKAFGGKLYTDTRKIKTLFMQAHTCVWVCMCVRKDKFVPTSIHHYVLLCTQHPEKIKQELFFFSFYFWCCSFIRFGRCVLFMMMIIIIILPSRRWWF